ncbi:GntR family transcriptional regulator [Phaeovulum sp. W22_SRMD_FR3]|uniref:GntR family transcriptional regulator n=1 Tax=Phaeovulum sp. W22_SRMD_FR3 TaxID=3240274 RepID=UPI003F944C26
MARDKNLFKLLVNRMLDRLADVPVGTALGSEGELAASLEASRTTVRAVLTHLAEAGILSWEGRQKLLLRAPRPEDRFDAEETQPRSGLVEEPFLNWVLQGDLPPGTTINEAELARRLGVPVATVREFLIRFEPLGLIEKRPNRSWILKGFTRDFAEEMFAVRDMFERRALTGLLAACAAPGPTRARLEHLHAAHLRLAAGPDAALAGFPALDAEFHQLLCAAANNRFISDFSRTISIIVHFHYRWNKRDELRRNRAAVAEHLAVIEAVLAGDSATATDALDAHLATAYRTLMASVIWSDG